MANHNKVRSGSKKCLVSCVSRSIVVRSDYLRRDKAERMLVRTDW